MKLSRLTTAARKDLLDQLGISALVLPVLALALGERGVGTLTATVVSEQCCCCSRSWGGLADIVGWFWLVRHHPATVFRRLVPDAGDGCAGRRGAARRAAEPGCSVYWRWSVAASGWQTGRLSRRIEEG